MKLEQLTSEMGGLDQSFDESSGQLMAREKRRASGDQPPGARMDTGSMLAGMGSTSSTFFLPISSTPIPLPNVSPVPMLPPHSGSEYSDSPGMLVSTLDDRFSFVGPAADVQWLRQVCLNASKLMAGSVSTSFFPCSFAWTFITAQPSSHRATHGGGYYG